MRMMTWAAVALLVGAGVALAGETVVVTTAADGTPANAAIQDLKLSGDGRIAAFLTAADNLVPGDTNGTWDLFAKNLETGAVTRVSLCADGSQLNADVTSMAVSREGNLFAFGTRADAFTPSGPELAKPAIYLVEQPSGPVEAVFYDPTTGPPVGNIGMNSVSADGGRMAFASDLPFVSDPLAEAMQVYVWDRSAATFYLANVNDAGEYGDGASWLNSGPGMTPDGRYVILNSHSTNLIEGDTNASPDIFLRDLQEGMTTRASVRDDGSEIPAYGSRGADYPAISADGRYVSFTSYGAVVVGVPEGTSQAYVRDLQEGTTQAVSTNGEEISNAYCWGSYVSSGDTSIALFQSDATNLVPGLTDGASLIYARDLAHGVTDVVSCESDGETVTPVGEGQFSPDETGEVVAFVAESTSALFRAMTTGPAQGYRRTRGPFWDVGSRHWAVTQIEACYAAGIVAGYPDGSYRPALPVTRDAMAVYISRALAGGDGAVPAGPGAATFSDVLTDHWAFKYVEYAVAQEVVGGYEGGTYRPSVTVTRDQMAVFVARGIAGGDSLVPSGPETATFTDVPDSHWAYRYVEYCGGEGVVGGYPDGTYRPLVDVTRDQMAVFVKRGFLP